MRKIRWSGGPSKKELERLLEEQEARRLEDIRRQKAAQEELDRQREEKARAEREDFIREQKRLQDQLRQKEIDDYKRKEQQRHDEEERLRIEHEKELKLKQEMIAQRARENRILDRQRKTEPQALRRLRELLRKRYQMDIYIWSQKDVQCADQHIIIDHGKKADAVLNEIRAIVRTWEADSGWTAEEWKVAETIKKQVLNSKQRIWENNPPWNEPDA